MSTTTATITCDEFLAAAREFCFLSPEAVELAAAHRKAHPRLGSEDLAGYLIEQNQITRFQANALLGDSARKLLLSQFTLVDEIGSGSMGTVYRARSSKDENWYAIKIVPRRNVINLQSIGEKVAALKQVRHPRVSAMVHVGAQGDRVYMVWPLLEGGENLEAVVKRQGGLPPRQAAQVGLQIASGLQAYHEHELFHGLLKPNDILIGSDRRVRILDFGVGFLLTCERGKSLLDTTTNTRALSRGLNCASPESIMDPLDRSPRGDQYSLGCILYFCVTGQYPFPSGNPVKKMMGHQFEEPTPLKQLVPDVSPKLEGVVHRLLRKQPLERYTCMEDVVADLQAATAESRNGGMPVVPRPITPPAVVRPSQFQQHVQKAPAPTSPSNGGAVKKAPAPTSPSNGGAVKKAPAPTSPSNGGAARLAPAKLNGAAVKDAPTKSNGVAPKGGLGTDLTNLWMTLAGVGAGLAAGLLVWYLMRN